MRFWSRQFAQCSLKSVRRICKWINKNILSEMIAHYKRLPPAGISVVWTWEFREPIKVVRGISNFENILAQDRLQVC